MRLLAISFCGFLVAMGALGVVRPRRLVEVVRRFQSTGGLYLAAAIRLAFGGSLLLVADGSRAPGVVHGLGIFLVVAGVITPFIGVSRFGRMLDWWAGRGDAFIRSWSCIALLFGLLVAYAVLPEMHVDR